MNHEEPNTSSRRRIPPAKELSYTGVPSFEYGEEPRDEKPWQRVFYGVTRKGTHLYEPVRSVPGALLIVLLGVYMLFGYFSLLVEDSMPRPIKDVAETRTNNRIFSEEAARRYLGQIIGNGPRVAGTRYHLTKTIDMKNVVDVIANQSTLPVHTDWQLVSGDYWLASGSPIVNCYQNLSNVIAVLEGVSGFHPNGSIGSSLLVNCHYDSVPFATGASDNGIFCAIMAETLSRLARSKKKFKHNIVFLFNGAEENPLQASHGFLYHPWSKGITTVVNLDAMGMNGKPNIFQVTDPRLLLAYKRTTYYPTAQGLAEYLFTIGVIPSDTDFRIWRDFGNINGVDIAFAKYGNVYHTRNDHPDLIQNGVIQCAGDMVMGLVAELADLDGLEDRVPQTPMVYYDYLNWFMVTYTFQVAIAVDVLITVFALLSVTYYIWLVGFRLSTVLELGLALIGRIAALAGGILVVTIFTAIMVATTMQLRYLSEMWIVVPLYWVPYLIGAVSVAHGFDAWRSRKSGLNRSIRTLQATAATRLLLAVILLVMTCIPSLVSMRYIITVPLFIMSAFACITITILRYVRLQAWQHLILETLFSLPSTMFLMTLMIRLNAVMIPTMGRSPLASPDYYIAVINTGMVVLASSVVSGIELLFSRKRLWIPVISLSVVCIIIMFIPMLPYRDEKTVTQRHSWFHTDILTYDENNQLISRTSGVLVTPQDAYTVSSMLAHLRHSDHGYNTRQDFTEDCDKYVYCNLPLYRTRFGPTLPHSLFIYMPGPTPFSPSPSLTVTSRQCVGELCTLHFNMIGPAHNTITLWPRENVNITGWSFNAPLRRSFMKNQRPVHNIIHSTATYSDVFAPLDFNVTFVVPLSQQSRPLMDLSFHAHKIYHPEDFTTGYKNLVESVPAYFNIASFMTFRYNYIV